MLVCSLIWNSAYAREVDTVSISNLNAHIGADHWAEEILGHRSLEPSSDLRGNITRSLEDEKIKHELSQFGIKKEEVEKRLAAMTDDELSQIQKGIERQVGGSVIAIGTTTLILLILILVLFLR